MDIKSTIKKMTLEEKADLCSGLDYWKTKPIERLGIPSIYMADGPHGLRKSNNEIREYGYKIISTVQSTCFPSAVSLASSWDRDLVFSVGQALGKECQAEDVQVL